MLSNRKGREILGLVKAINLHREIELADLKASGSKWAKIDGKVRYVPSVGQVLRHGLWFLAEPLIPNLVGRLGIGRVALPT